MSTFTVCNKLHTYLQCSHISLLTFSSKMSLLQLALPDKVYLLDIMTLSRVLTPQDWGYLTELVFCNETVIKLGKLKVRVGVLPHFQQPRNQLNLMVCNVILWIDTQHLKELECLTQTTCINIY